VGVVHNGIIENFRELKSELEAQGARFSSDTDSEVIAHLLARGGKDLVAAALAVRAGQLVYVGDVEGARALVGPHTRVQDAHGRFVLPGLVDSHIHPPDIIEADFCNLKTVGKSLRGIADFVRDCVRRYRPAPGEWLVVYQWSKTSDNHPDSEYPNLRVTLDKAAPRNPVVMFADDGHHGAFNSAALALARNRHGKVVGLSKQTLASDFADDRMLIGVDAHGDPDGAVDEEARFLIDTAHRDYLHLDAVMANPEAIPRQLNRAGITAVLDASLFEDGVPIYEKLQASGHMTMRATLHCASTPIATSTRPARSTTTASSNGPRPRARALPAIHSCAPISSSYSRTARSKAIPS
jgi:predicted amidohydrolase YtcJ